MNEQDEIGKVTGERCGTWKRDAARATWACDHGFGISDEDLRRLLEFAK